jgi:hypothetical protein
MSCSCSCPTYTLSILIALPLAFAVTFGAGVAMERLIIRWLYHRPLETLLATFGISIALQQLAKNIFGTQARPFTAPDWLRRRVRAQRCCLDQLHPHRDLRARAGVPGAVPVRHEQNPPGAGGARRHAEPAHGGVDGHQPRQDQHADLRLRLGHCGHRRRGDRPFRSGDHRDGPAIHRAVLHDRGRRRRRQRLGHAGWAPA